jgi:hypothetical protein
MSMPSMFTPRLSWLVTAAIATGLLTPTAIAESVQGEKIIIAGAGQSLDVRGYAKGTVSLYKTIADRDSRQNRCMGYGSLQPDHLMEIQKQTSEVTLQIRTRSQDTTLLVEGPDNRFYCVDDSPEGGKDAGLSLKNVKAGSYKVWIGTFDAGVGARYVLNVQSK